MTAPDREAPSTSWAVWAWQAYRDGRLVETDPAAIRAAALREAEEALRDWQDSLNTHRSTETAITVGMAADVVLALIGKEPGNG